MKRIAKLFIVIIIFADFLVSVSAQEIKGSDSEGTAESGNSTNQLSKENDKSEGVIPGWYLNLRTAVAVNYLAAIIKADFYYRIPFIKKSGRLWETTKFDIGIQEFICPSFQRLSLYLKFEPIAVFDITAYAGYDYIYYISGGGLFGSGFQEVSDEDAEYDSETRDKLNGYGKGGFRTTITPTFKIAIGNFAALYSFRIEYHNYDFDGYYYDHNTFIIHKGNDFLFEHNVKLLYKFGPFKKGGNLRLGVNWLNYSIQNTGKNSMKLCGMFVYQPKWERCKKGTEPYVVILSGSHLQDKYNVGRFYMAILLGVNLKVM